MADGKPSGLVARVGVRGLVVFVVILAALAFIGVSVWRDMGPEPMDIAAGRTFTCTVLSVYDGDGPINCAEVDTEGQPVSVRLRGIEARDNDNSCQLREETACPRASGAEAKAMLTQLAVGRLQCTSFGPSYNRVDASCQTASGVDLSCEMLRSGMAVRWPEYDPEGRLIRCTPGAR